MDNLASRLKKVTEENVKLNIKTSTEDDGKTKLLDEMNTLKEEMDRIKTKTEEKEKEIHRIKTYSARRDKEMSDLADLTNQKSQSARELDTKQKQ